MISLVIAAQPVPGTPEMARSAVRWDETFPTVNAVTGTPADWVAALCAPQIPPMGPPIDPYSTSGAQLLFPGVGLTLPGAISQVACIAQDYAASDPLLLVALYPAEAPMQRDLVINGFKWYCFAAVQGRLFVAATRAAEQTTDDGWSVSPILQPLTAFGFLVYRDPGR